MAQLVRQRIKVHQDWAGDIPLKNLWGVYFSAREGSMTNLGENIQEVVDQYQPRTYQVETGLIDRFSSDDAGYLLAQNVAMPKESFQVSTTGINNVGGFIGGYVGGNRTEYGSSNIIDIEFLETNVDVFDFFIKPWIVATSFKGLIEEDGTPDIKCNITVAQYTRTDAFYGDKWGSSQNPRRGFYSYKVRKITNLFNCAPINVNADMMSYNEISENDLTKPVGWTFSHYEINNPNSNNAI